MQLTALGELAQVHQQSLHEAISSSDPPQQIENEFIDQYVADLEWIIESLEELPSIRSQVHEYVTSRLPTFIYMDDYRRFRGTAQLDEIRSRGG